MTGLAVAGGAVLGLMIGSFLNVVVYRVPLGRSIASPPSACPSCGSRIRPYDNVPVVSWLLLRGKCRYCSAPISIRYPIVEAIVGLLFTLAWWALPPVDLTAAVVLGVAWYLAATWVIALPKRPVLWEPIS